MPTAYVPEVDRAACSAWTEQDNNMYNALPYYFAKLQIEYRKHWAVWSPLFGKRKWEPNMGPIMRGVRVEPSPHIRQVAYPNALCALPKVDIVTMNEVSVDAYLARQRFESPVFDFCPHFRTFITDHVDRHVKDVNEKLMRYEDIYLRTQVLEGAPHIWVAGKKGGVAQLTAVPVNTDGTQTKTTALLKALGDTVGTNLSLCEIDTCQTVAENDLRVPPFSGSTRPVDNAGLDDKWVLILSSEAWNQFKYDPWMLANRPIDLNVVTEKFKGSLWGKMVCRLEDLPLRMAADGTFPAPQTVEMNPAAYNYGETLTNPDYSNAPYEFAWLVGAEGYESLEVGPPPKAFAGNGMPNGFGKMQWNGEIFLTKNLLVPCLDTAGNTIMQPNIYGEKLKIACQAVFGAVGKQRRNIIPIIYQRKRGC